MPLGRGLGPGRFEPNSIRHLDEIRRLQNTLIAFILQAGGRADENACSRGSWRGFGVNGQPTEHSELTEAAGTTQRLTLLLLALGRTGVLLDDFQRVFGAEALLEQCPRTLDLGRRIQLQEACGD